MLKIYDLTKKYGNLIAVDNLSLDINEGEIFGFIGPNGAGKTTTINCILNFINKDSGQILINNQIMSKQNESLKEIIGYVPSEVNLYGDLTVKEMINLTKTFYKKTISTSKLVKQLDLDLNKKVDTLSFGNLKKLSIILALIHEPKLLILDEPTSGLDPLIKEEFFKILLEQKRKGTTIFFSSHNLSEVKRICDRIGILKNGKLIALEKTDILTKTDFHIITITGEEYKQLKLPIKEIVIKEKSDTQIKFIYKGNINDLINILSDIKISDLLIEEPTIDEIFMHYYK